VKAFLLAMVVMVAVSAIAAVATGSLPTSSKETFTVKDSVRLPGQND
jgi:hypothetical protein